MIHYVIGMYPPVSSNISSLIFPATETSMASSGILQPATFDDTRR